MDSGLSDFFRQIPVGLLATFCVSLILLVGAIAYIVYARRKRGRVLTTANTAETPTIETASADLPDLDALINAPLVQTAEIPALRRSVNGTYTVNLTGGTVIEAVEVLTVLRDVTDGGLIVQIGDKAYRNPPTAADAEFKRRYNVTVRELAAVTADPPPPPAPVEPTAAASAPVNQPAVVSPPVEPAADDLLGDEAVPGALPKFTLPDLDLTQVKKRRKQASEPIPEINIAAAIESYLQHKLARTPEYAGRSVHVRPAPGGGVTIEVDGKFYETVGDVDDAAVRQFLSATIEEWQSRQ